MGLKLKYRTAGSGFESRRKKKICRPPRPNPPSKCGAAKNIYAKQERLTLVCRVTWVSTERVNKILNSVRQHNQLYYSRQL